MDNNDFTLTNAENTKQENTIAGDNLSIPVIEEHVHIGKKVVETGKVKVSTLLTEREESVNIPLLHEEVNVERIPINKFIEAAPAPVRYEGDTLIVPITREVVVKRLLLVEELHVTKRKISTEETQQFTLRTQEVNVERIDNKT